MSNQIINCQDLCKFFPVPKGGLLKALDNITFELRQGEILGIVGPNGAGKTTLLRAISGYINSSRGSIYVNGKHPIQALEHGDIGLSFGEPRFSRELTVGTYWRAVSNLVYPINPDDSEVFEFMGMSSFMDKKIGQLSKGMTQRLGLSLCLALPRSIYLLDEPTDGLDVNYRIQLKQFLLSLKKEGAAVLLASHDLSVVESICDRVLILHHGRMYRELSNGRHDGVYIIRFTCNEDCKQWVTGAVSVGDGIYQLQALSDKDRQMVCKRIIENNGDILELRRRGLEDVIDSELMENAQVE